MNHDLDLPTSSTRILDGAARIRCPVDSDLHVSFDPGSPDIDPPRIDLTRQPVTPLPDAELLRVAAFRRDVYAMGFRPVEVRTRQKAPLHRGWPAAARSNPPLCTTLEATVSKEALSTGLICDDLQAIDVDVDDQEVVDQAFGVIREMFGDTPTRYRSDSARILMLFAAADADMRKRALSGQHGAVEVMGRGQQVVVDGIHPNGARYAWRNGSPDRTAQADLRALTKDDVDALFVALGPILGVIDPLPLTTSSANDQSVRNAAPFASPTATERERAYAQAALAGNAAKLAAMSRGGRNQALNGCAYRMGRMETRGWITATEVERALREACTANGLLDDDGIGSIAKTIASGLRSGAQKPHDDLEDDIHASFSVSLSEEQAAAAPIAGAPSPAVARQGPAPWDAPDLSVLRSTRRPAPRFDTAVLGPVLEAWAIRAAAASSAPIDYVAVSLLAIAGATIGNARWPFAGASWSEPPILWCCLVGNPSSGKSPAMGAALELCQDAEERLAEGHDELLRAFETTKRVAALAREKWDAEVAAAVKAGELAPIMPRKALEPIIPTRPRIIVADATTEKLASLSASLPRGLVSVRDELAGWLASFGRYGGGGTDRAFALEMYGGRLYLIDRVKDPKGIRVEHLTVGVLGGIQPDRLAEAIDGADDGLAPRFLWSWPEPISGFTVSRVMMDSQNAKDAIVRLSELALGEDEFGKPIPIKVLLNHDAVDMLEAFGREMIVRGRHAPGIMAGTIGKARGHVLRLSCILEFLRWAASPIHRPAPTAISLDAVSDACDLVESYFLPMAEAVFGDAIIPKAERLAMTLARHLREAGALRFNARDVRRSIGGVLRAPADMDMACSELIEAGLIRSAPTRSGPTTGRMAKSFDVNPKLHEAS